MEVNVMGLLWGLVTILIASMLLMVVEWAWLKPKRLEKWLRRQGLSGNPYRVFVGDIKDMVGFHRQATSKPMEIPLDSHHQVVQRMMPFVHHVIAHFGKKSFTWMGPTPTIIITDPKLVREIFVRHDIFQKFKMTHELLVTGLVNYDGEKWSRIRKIVNPAFLHFKIKDMFPSVYWSCNNLILKWKKILESNQSHDFDVWPDIQILTSDVISRTAFGNSYEDGRKVFEFIKQQVKNLSENYPFSFIPGWRFLPTPVNRRMKRNYKQTRAVIEGLINQREEAIKHGEANTDDLLGMLIESTHKESQEEDQNKESGMSIDEVIEECKLFYLAGQETTASLLVYAMVLLSIHEDWQQLAREEVHQIFQNDEPKFEHLNNLKVVTKILNEVLRLYPPVVGLLRSSCGHTKLGDIEIRPGVIVSIPIIILQHDCEYWGDDADEFNPNRFSEGVSKAAKTNEVPFFPFGWGPRICVGQNFALMEAKLVLAMILQNFSFKLSSNYVHAPVLGISIQPQHGACLILQEI